jgi:hypothetical protein
MPILSAKQSALIFTVAALCASGAMFPATGVNSPRVSYRMRRGGGWDDGGGCRSARRDGDNPSDANCNIGFRLARSRRQFRFIACEVDYSLLCFKKTMRG